MTRIEMIGHNSKWISIACRPSKPGAPLLRREFKVESPIASATLLISGLGYYEAWINGQRVGDHVLDPAQTDYEKRVFYVSHDVTQQITAGLNAIGVMLGNGWYNQDRVWGEKGLSYGEPRLLAELHIVLDNGRELVFCSDERWTGSTGPVTDNNIYAGESYDARLEQLGWCCSGFDDAAWESATLMPPPGGRLERQKMPPIRRIETRSPVSISHAGTGRYVVDLGQNFAGWVRIQVEAVAGTEIQMRFAEELAQDGTLDTASTGVFATKVEQIDRYICKGEGLEIWEPRFTYHGFRYVEVTGWPGELTNKDILGIVVHTDLPVAGSFACSDERLNRLHQMALWTHRSNIHGLPEDCPARERCGWLGDANVSAEFSMWNFNGKTFWEKFLDDIETTREINGGLPCNIAPGKRTGRTANPDWAAAFLMLPWYLYVQYGDGEVLKKHWEGMERLIEHFGDQAKSGIIEGGYGDWFDPGGDSVCTHTPPTLTTSFWFYRCAQVMADAAALLGKQEASERYRGWTIQIRDALILRFYNHDTGSFGSQTADAMALSFGLTPEGEEARVLDSLVGDIRKRDTHLNTGIMGVRFLFEVLTQHGHGELALALLHQNTYPSFGNLIQRGATTLWEYWGESKHDQIRGRRSLNHPMMGGFDNWFYNTLAGIRPDPEHPGFLQFFLEPHPIPGIDWLNVHHDGPHGRIVSNWKRHNGSFEWDVVVPENCTAVATLPNSRQVHTLKAGAHHFVDGPLA